MHLPGYGASPPLEGTYTVARVTELIERELTARGVDEAAIVGHSAGAYRAFALALSGRIRVTDLVSLSGVAGYDPALCATFRELARSFRAGCDLRATWLELMAGPSFVAEHPEQAAEVLRWLDAAPASVLADEYDAFADAEDLRPRLRQLAVPVLARVGQLDHATPVAFSRVIVDNAPDATLQIVEGCGHALLYEDAVPTVDAVAAALGA